MVTELSVHYTLGSNVRVDTTLLGFHNMRWQRGHQSFLFATDSEWLSLVMVTQLQCGNYFTVSSAHMYIIDYDRNIVYEDKLSLVEKPPQSRLEQQMRLEADLASRLTSPVISTIFNAKQLAFQRYTTSLPCCELPLPTCQAKEWHLGIPQ